MYVTVECVVLNKIFKPLPPRLRKHHEKKGGNTERTRQQGKGLKIPSSRYDTVIAIMNSQ